LKKPLLLLIALFVALATYLVFDGNSDQQARIDRAATPEQLAIALLQGGKSQATSDHRVLSIERTVDAILTASWAVSGFNLSIARVVPAVFAKFPQVQSIVFHESGPFRDIKGNESTDEMLRIAFMRSESDQIHWDKINYDDIPKLGEHYWMHPGLRRALQPVAQ
jgi:hypothetical protein